MARAAAEGVLSIEKLEAMTAVCSLGLDMIVVPGDTSRTLWPAPSLMSWRSA